MNVYDFDKTVYDGDSSVDFVLFSFRRQPSLLRYAPSQLKGYIKYASGSVDKTRMKEYVFSFLRGLRGREELVRDFWELRFKRIFPWYLSVKRSDDVIISASPEFLLAPACSALGVRLIGSRVDIETGRFDGKNCHDVEKVARFRAEFPDAVCDRFYSDSYSDAPMAELALEAYLTRHGVPKPWDFTKTGS